MKKHNTKDTAPLSRREFIGKSAVAAAGFAFASQYSFGAPAILKNLGKPN
ncbi:MAG TPA: twin-arginine translocation signal domain-containing protein, partial [Chryseolinea sp.]